ncbi:DUF488 family protein [Vagococcus sp. BWB3-3]|uniref:DUF488 family protein n=1 Tax=Vagococcus allomyrinae TaxID=2794353 RepID=A0A940P8M6_9ENTE|nr:DUF488 family protein [Vagococcus allomyrinae]MBP1043085.1 DUF488 family protein [Vagococcus allomyrinae]
MIYLKRVYAEAMATDGYRVLIDRLWPRGVKKEMAKIDYWAKELTPSTDLRKWYHQFPEQRSEFARRYQRELIALPEAQHLLHDLAERSHGETITFVYAAKDQVNNHGVILMEWIASRFKGEVDLSTNQ